MSGLISDLEKNEESKENSEPELMTSEEYQERTIEIFEQAKSQDVKAEHIQIPEAIQEAIFEKNKRFWLTRFIFSRTFLENSLEIFKSVDFKPNRAISDAKEDNSQTLEQLGSADE